MSWQLWVLIALSATGLGLLAVARMRHARHVFDDITSLDRPSQSSQPAAGRPPGFAGLASLAGRPGFTGRLGLTGDELAWARARRLDPGVRGDEPAQGPRRKHG